LGYRDAFSKVDGNREYIVEILKKLIAVDTSVPPGNNYGEFVDAVEPEFRLNVFVGQGMEIVLALSLVVAFFGDRAGRAAVDAFSAGPLGIE